MLYFVGHVMTWTANQKWEARNNYSSLRSLVPSVCLPWRQRCQMQWAYLWWCLICQFPSPTTMATTVLQKRGKRAQKASGLVHLLLTFTTLGTNCKKKTVQVRVERKSGIKLACIYCSLGRTINLKMTYLLKFKGQESGKFKFHYCGSKLEFERLSMKWVQNKRVT